MVQTQEQDDINTQSYSEIIAILDMDPSHWWSLLVPYQCILVTAAALVKIFAPLNFNSWCKILSEF